MAKKKGILGFLGGATRVVFKTASIACGLTGAYYITKNIMDQHIEPKLEDSKVQTAGLWTSPVTYNAPKEESTPSVEDPNAVDALAEQERKAAEEAAKKESSEKTEKKKPANEKVVYPQTDALEEDEKKATDQEKSDAREAAANAYLNAPTGSSATEPSNDYGE